METATTTHYQPGDQANGHVLTNDGVWVPLHQGAPAPEPKNASKKTWIKVVGAGVASLLLLGIVSGMTDSAPASSVPPAADSAASSQNAETDSAASSADALSGVDGTWDIDVTEVLLNGNAQVAAANEFNDAPSNQYVLVTVQGTNVSSDFEDLSWLQGSILGSDNVVYDEAFAVTPLNSFENQTEAAPGGTVKYQFVFDVPAAALDGGYLMLGYDRVRVAL